jgi:hypothetical protein
MDWFLILPAFLLWCLYMIVHRYSKRPAAIIWASWIFLTIGLAVFGAVYTVEGQECTRIASSVLSASLIGLVGPWLVLCHTKDLPFLISLPVSIGLSYALMLPMFFLLAALGQIWGM